VRAQVQMALHSASFKNCKNAGKLNWLHLASTLHHLLHAGFLPVYSTTLPLHRSLCLSVALWGIRMGFLFGLHPGSGGILQLHGLSLYRCRVIWPGLRMPSALIRLSDLWGEHVSRLWLHAAHCHCCMPLLHATALSDTLSPGGASSAQAQTFTLLFGFVRINLF